MGASQRALVAAFALLDALARPVPPDSPLRQANASANGSRT
jgi:hypothetical protein